MTTEVLYCARNRFAFTRASFELLRENTDWRQVSRLVVYDDSSEDGTAEWLDEAIATVPVDFAEIRHVGWGSVAAVMNDYVAETDADAFVKVDNDIAMPPGWFSIVREVAQRHPKIALIGMEAAFTSQRLQNGVRTREREVIKANHIGGIGFMRVQAFTSRKPLRMRDPRTGFTIWQSRYHVPAGWLTPDLPNVQLDRIPTEPWLSLAAEYVARGWARYWKPYEHDMTEWWDWIPPEVVP